MEFSPRAAELTTLSQLFASFSLVTFTFLGIFFLDLAVPGQFFVKNIVASLGGAAALYYIFVSRTYLSSVTTLYAFFMSAWILCIIKNYLDLELSILILLTVSGAFFFSFFWNSNINLDPVFLVIFSGFLSLIGLDWTISFIVELLILFCFQSHIKKKAIFLSLSLLLLLAFYLHFIIGVHLGFRIGVVFLFGAAGAGGLQFLCLNKTEWGQGAGFVLYVVSNVILGLVLQEGTAFPKITLFFLMAICFGLLFVYLLSRIQNESLSAVVTGSKTLLRGAFLPLLYLLNGLFFHEAYYLWIASFVIHILILLLFKFILKNEDQDPIL